MNKIKGSETNVQIYYSESSAREREWKAEQNKQKSQINGEPSLPAAAHCVFSDDRFIMRRASDGWNIAQRQHRRACVAMVYACFWPDVQRLVCEILKLITLPSALTRITHHAFLPHKWLAESIKKCSAESNE